MSTNVFMIYSRKGMCLGSRDQEINDSISETVQDRDIVAMED